MCVIASKLHAQTRVFPHHVSTLRMPCGEKILTRFDDVTRHHAGTLQVGSASRYPHVMCKGQPISVSCKATVCSFPTTSASVYNIYF
jgi:hypothetical protein